MTLSEDTEESTLGVRDALRQRAQGLADGMDRTLPLVNGGPDFDALRHANQELQVHQIELEMQNSELRRLQLENAAARERYFDLYDLAPVGYCTLNERGQLLEVNLAAAKLLGMAGNALIGRFLQRFVIRSQHDLYERCRVQLQASGKAQTCELQLVQSHGVLLWVKLTMSSARDAAGTPALRVVLDDVTDRKIMSEAMLASEERYRALVEGSPDAIAVHRNGKIAYANDAAVKLFGASCLREVLGLDVLDRVHPASRAVVQARMARTERCEGATPMIEETMLKLDGTAMEVEVQSNSTTLDGAPATQVVMRDITERKRQAQEILRTRELLRESALHTQTILDNMADGVITIGMQGRVESFNQAASSIFGYDAQEVLRRNVSMLMPAPHSHLHDSYLQEFQQSGASRDLHRQRELEGLHKNGNVFHMSLSVSHITRAGQSVFIGLVRDITQRRKELEEIRRMAFYDVLTQLPNRRLMMDRLRKAMLTSERTRQHGAVMFLDMDYFKLLNDSFGHDVGDELLQQIGVRLQACVREGDTVARMGGDEFVVLLDALSEHASEAAAQADLIAAKILESLEQPYFLRGRSHSSTSSIGIVAFCGHGDGPDDVLKKADLAMYQAKSTGRNRACFFDPTMQGTATALSKLEKDMRRGLALHEFALHYQVQVNGAGETTGAEALVRWNHVTQGMVWPATFIPLAEETGMILPLGQWVMESACSQLASWAGQEETALWTMSVNVSLSQFTQDDFVASVVGALQKTGANPHLLKLELTESLLVNHLETVKSNMNALKLLGVRFSLDDFGTGYSSLSRLKELPLDQLKIDQSFVQSVLTNASDAAIAHTVMALGHSLGLHVIAEGVETAGQRDFLAGLGCNAFQGYYFGRPGPASDLTSARQ